MDLLREDLDEMKRQFPSFRIIREEGEGISHTADVFLCTKDYRKFKADIYACMMPALFLGADIYEHGEFQYCIGTWSGELKENLNMLEKTLKEIAKKGLDAVKPKLDGDKLGIREKKYFSYHQNP